MSKDYFNNPFMGSDWAGLFNDYMNGLNSFGTFVPGHEQTRADQWQKAMEFWWKSMQSEVPGIANPTAQRLLEQSRTFYMLGQQFSDLLEKLSSVSTESSEYLQYLVNQIESMKAVMQASRTLGHHSVSDVLDAWQVPGDLWSHYLKNIAGADKDISHALIVDDLDTFMDKYLNLPGVGYAREYQEKLQKNAVLLKEFLKASEEYNEAMGNVGTRALDSLRDRIIDMAKNGEQITSLRQLYNLWVDCNEEAYADFVFSKEYSALYGNLVNAMSAYRLQSNGIRDDILASHSLPTRGDLEAMQKQSANFSKKLNRAMARHHNDELRIEELEKQLNELMSQEVTADVPDKKASGNSAVVTKKTGVGIGDRTTSRDTGKETKKKAGKKAAKKASGAKTGQRSKRKMSRKKAEVKKTAPDTKVVNIGSRKSEAAGGDASTADSGGKNSSKKTIEIKF
jgi:class III poly(R)-hydroxyalkanoic acid synthase PhaE subunit